MSHNFIYIVVTSVKCIPQSRAYGLGGNNHTVQGGSRELESKAKGRGTIGRTPARCFYCPTCPFHLLPSQGKKVKADVNLGWDAARLSSLRALTHADKNRRVYTASGERCQWEKFSWFLNPMMEIFNLIK